MSDRHVEVIAGRCGQAVFAVQQTMVAIACQSKALLAALFGPTVQLLRMLAADSKPVCRLSSSPPVALP